jgi:hypothetical protein
VEKRRPGSRSKTEEEEKMKVKMTNVLIAAVLMTFIGQPLVAQETRGQDHQAHEQASSMSPKMHERMQAMQQQMEKIHATEDAGERKRLMHEHMQSMRDSMMMMGNMRRPMMQPGQEGTADTGHQRHAPRCQDDTAQCKQMNEMARRQGHMEQRMEMMQMMMQQMMERDAVNESEQN